LEKHPELEAGLPLVLRAIEAPDLTMPGRYSNEEWFLAAEAGPSRWLQVVVIYEKEAGSIITAFARRSDP